jgi:uncharacterized protein (DUF1778 family)
MEEKRTVRVEINLTELEAAELRAAAHISGLQTATFVRVEAMKAARRLGE